MRLFPLALLAVLPLPSLAGGMDYQARVLTIEAIEGEAGGGLESLMFPLASGHEADGELAIHCRPHGEPWINFSVDREWGDPGSESASAEVTSGLVDVTTQGITLGAFIFMWGRVADPLPTAMIKVQGQRTVLAVLRALEEDGALSFEVSSQGPLPFGNVVLTLPEDPPLRDRIAALTAVSRS